MFSSCAKNSNRTFTRCTAVATACAMLFSILAPSYICARNLGSYQLRAKTKAAEYNQDMAQKVLALVPLPVRAEVRRILNERSQTPRQRFFRRARRQSVSIHRTIHKLVRDPRFMTVVSILCLGLDLLSYAMTGHWPKTDVGSMMLIAGGGFFPFWEESPFQRSLRQSFGVGEGKLPRGDDPKIVETKRHAFEYPSTGIHRPIDLPHFFYALRLLADRNLRVEFFEDRIEKGFTKDFIDEVNGKSFVDPKIRLHLIEGQNSNPLAQGVLEAVSNSLDAFGFKIGQFSRGVKQILQWLEPTGEDRVEVYTGRGGADGKFYRETIFQSPSGQGYVHLAPVNHDDFLDAAGMNLESGTVVQVTAKDKIPRKNSEIRSRDRKISQEAIVEELLKRYAYVTGVKITIEIEGRVQLIDVNQWNGQEVIVGAPNPPYDSSSKERVHIRLTDHSITVIDSGSGMNAKEIALMFVRGAKIPLPIDAEAEKKNVRVVRAKKLPHRISFARNQEVIFSLDIPASIAKEATVEGGLMLDGGALIDVTESRDVIVIRPSPIPGGKSHLETAVEHAVEQIVSHPTLLETDRLKIINTIAIGLDGLIQENKSNEIIIERLKEHIKGKIDGIVKGLKKEGILFLPHSAQFRALVPENRKVVFLHEGIFYWRGSQDLEELGGHLVPGVKVGGKELVVVPFRQGFLKYLARLFIKWTRLTDWEREPVIRTKELIVIPLEGGWDRLYVLAKKRVNGPRENRSSKDGLTAKERKEFQSLCELLNVQTQERVKTAGIKVKRNVEIIPVDQLIPEGEEVDSEAIRKFHKRFQSKAAAGEEKDETPHAKDIRSEALSRANMKYALLNNGEVMEIGTGNIVDLRNFSGNEEFVIESLKPLIHGYYDVVWRPRNGTRKGIYAQIVKLKDDRVVAMPYCKPYHVSISPDKRFFFLPYSSSRIYSFEADAAIELEDHLPKTTQEETPTEVNSLSQFSPDGKYLAFIKLQLPRFNGHAEKSKIRDLEVCYEKAAI